MSHTKGPWVAKRLIDSMGRPYESHYIAHINIGVCMVWAPVGHTEQEANARLIAAAPDLLEALMSGLDFADQISYQFGGLPIPAEIDSFREKARAAIARVEADELIPSGEFRETWDTHSASGTLFLSSTKT